MIKRCWCKYKSIHMRNRETYFLTNNSIKKTTFGRSMDIDIIVDTTKAGGYLVRDAITNECDGTKKTFINNLM